MSYVELNLFASFEEQAEAVAPSGADNSGLVDENALEGEKMDDHLRKTSGPSSFRSINPKPLETLNHFTVPVTGIASFYQKVLRFAYHFELGRVFS